jgi:glycosyltransferase involved in cell wall biosynthesis
MRVAMIGWEYPPFKAGGLGTHCYGLTRSLADNQVSVDFFMPKTKSKATSDNPNLRIIEVGEASFFPYQRPDDKEIAGGFFDSVYRYNDLVVQRVKGNYDVIHCHDWLTIPAGVQLKEKLNVPLVLSVHSTEYDRSGWLSPNQWFIDIERQGMEKADVIIAVSHFTKRVIVEKYGIDEQKIRVIHNAVYPLGEGEKKNIVLFLGRLTIQKGPEFFLEAAKKVLEYGQKTRFVVAGKGDMLPRLIDKAVNLGISKNVMFTGLLSDEEVRHIYQIANVYVMPSVSEPFGITALEAVSAGTPVIVSKTAGVAEALKHCLRVDFWDVDEMANKIISLLKYDSLHRTLSDHGKKELDLFTWDQVAHRTMNVYGEVA